MKSFVNKSRMGVSFILILVLVLAPFQIPFSNAVTVKAAAGGDVLKLTINNNNSTIGKWTKINFSNAAYIFQSGDYIEYDVMLTGSVCKAGGIDIKCTDGSYFKNCDNWQDQNGLDAKSWHKDISELAANSWYHRKIRVPSSMVGKTAQKWLLYGENDSHGRSYTVYYDNIKVTDGSSTTKVTAYSDGTPSVNTVDNSSGIASHTLSAVALSSVNVGSTTGAPSGNILRFFVQNSENLASIANSQSNDGDTINSSPNRFVYWMFSNSSYTVQAGDYLEYDMKLDAVLNSHTPGIGVDIQFTDGTYIRDYTGWGDQDGVGGHPGNDVTKAYKSWHHRKLALPSSSYGKTISKWMVSSEHDAPRSKITAYFDNIKITNGTATRIIASDGSTPIKNEAVLINEVNYAVLSSETQTYAVPNHGVVAASSTYPTEDIVIKSFTVGDFGAVGDGNADDTKAFQNALYAASAIGGGVVYAPAANYRINGHLYIPKGVTLRGQWKNPDNGGLGIGTILRVYENKGNESGMPFIALEANSAVENLSVFYPEQSYSNVYAYPWCIQMLGGNNSTVENVTLYNPYKGIYMGPMWNETAYLRNVYGTPLKRGIMSCFTTDVARMEGIKFTPTYWANSGFTGAPSGTNEATLKNWTGSNGIAYEAGRVDWIYMYNVTFRSYETGIHLVHRFSKLDVPSSIQAANGNAVKLNIDDCHYGINVEEMNAQGFTVIDSTINATRGTDPTCIKTTSSFTTFVSFNKCSFGGTPKESIVLQGDGVAQLQNCTFGDWGYSGGTYAINAQQGSLTVQGSNFQKNAKAINLTSSVDSAAILGNTFNGSPQIDNSTGKGTAYVMIDNSAMTFDQVPAAGHVYRSSEPKPASSNFYNVKLSPYNAVGDGVTNDTTAIQNALTAAGNAGGTVFLPAGKYRLDGTLNVPAGVELRGIFDTPHHMSGDGSVLLSYGGKDNETGTPFITLQQNAGLRGISVYYPEQEHLNVHAYPWTVRGNGSGVYVINSTFANSYNGIDFGLTNASDNHYVDNVLGCFLKTGIGVGKSATEGWVQNVHINPHLWARALYYPNNPSNNDSEWVSNVFTYMKHNLEAIKMGYCNNEHMLANFNFASYYGIHAVSQPEGKANATIYLPGIDCSLVGLMVDDTGSNGINIIGMTQYLDSDQQYRRGVWLNASNTGAVKVFGYSVAGGLTQFGADIDAGTCVLQSTVFASGCSMMGVSCDGGTSRIDNLYQAVSSNDAYIGAGINSARFLGGVYVGNFDITNGAGTKGSWYGNVIR